MSVTPKSEEAPLSFQGLVRLAVNHIYSFCEWNHFKYDHVIGTCYAKKYVSVIKIIQIILTVLKNVIRNLFF